MVVYICNRCKKLFNKSDSYNKHLKRINLCQPYWLSQLTDTKVYKCDDCNRIFNRKGNLYRHIRDNCLNIRIELQSKFSNRITK
jgi:DNA-directed RNA polymerase subunit RPC12/RpoP